MKRLLCLFAVLAGSPAFAAEPDLSSPTAAVRSYLVAIKANDIEAAKKCWTVDDDAAGGMLDVVVGIFVESRKLVAAASAKFGTDGLTVIGRANRPDCTDRAIDRTLERVAAASVRMGDTAARLVVTWGPEDRQADPAFHCGFPFRVRRSGDQWKLDAGVLAGGGLADHPAAAARFVAIGRDEMALMRDLTAGLEKGQFKDLAEFERESKARVEAMRAKYSKKE